MAGKHWTNEEIEELKRMYLVEGLVPKEIAPLLNKTRTSVLVKAKRLRLIHTIDQTNNAKSRLFSGEGNGMYGKQGWCKGLTTENSEKQRQTGTKISEVKKRMFAEGLIDVSGSKNGMYGKSSWRKGETKESNDKIKIAGEKCSETKKRMFAALPEEEKEKIRRRWAMAGLKCKKKDTSIEVKVKQFLVGLGIEFLGNHPIGRFIADVFIPDRNLVIECQGDYWHCNPNKYSVKNATVVQRKNLDRDRRKAELYKEQKIDVLYLWECEINKDFEGVKQRILERLSSGKQ